MRPQRRRLCFSALWLACAACALPSVQTRKLDAGSGTLERGVSEQEGAAAGTPSASRLQGAGAEPADAPMSVGGTSGSFASGNGGRDAVSGGGAWTAGSGGAAPLDSMAALCAGCAPEAYCIRAGKAATCSCPPTHVGDGETCTANAGCSALGCDAHAVCELMPAPHCVCPPGWGGDGLSCTDMDECGAPDVERCTGNATCVNLPGGWSCKCAAGFLDVNGDGSDCVDKCKLAACDPNATCQLQGDQAVCTCKTGYSGDGKSCRVEDPCRKIKCAVEATCRATSGTASCSCNSGFMGDGFRCTPSPYCGDGTRNGTEQCDGRDLNGNSCVSLGHSGGTLGCTGKCLLDDSLCTGPAQASGGSGA